MKIFAKRFTNFTPCYKSALQLTTYLWNFTTKPFFFASQPTLQLYGCITVQLYNFCTATLYDFTTHQNFATFYKSVQFYDTLEMTKVRHIVQLYCKLLI